MDEMETEQHSGQSMDLILFSGEYDKAMAALVLANTAREMDVEVNMFFAFWGLALIRDPQYVPEQDKDKSLYGRMFSLIAPKGPEDMPLSRMNWAGIGKAMMLEMIDEHEAPRLIHFLKGARKKNVHLYACKMSVEVMGYQPEEFLPEVQIVEAKDFLKGALQSNLQLFI